MSALINSYAQIKFSGIATDLNPTTTAVKITGFDSGTSSPLLVGDYSNSKIVFADNGSFKLNVIVEANVDDQETYAFFLKVNGVTIGNLDFDIEKKTDSLEFNVIGYLPAIVEGDEVELYVDSGNAGGSSFIPTHLLMDAFKVGT